MNSNGLSIAVMFILLNLVPLLFFSFFAQYAYEIRVEKMHRYYLVRYASKLGASAENLQYMTKIMAKKTELWE